MAVPVSLFSILILDSHFCVDKCSFTIVSHLLVSFHAILASHLGECAPGAIGSYSAGGPRAMYFTQHGDPWMKPIIARLLGYMAV